jgi:ubiquinone/menaquinone biosynthesis C-methylase UbiE
VRLKYIRGTVGNTDTSVVESFGREWQKFDHSAVDAGELEAIFEKYFEIFPWSELPSSAVGFDLGCGSGRWAYRVANRVGVLHCIDASAAALEVARRNLAQLGNCQFHCASVDALPLAENSADFGYALGVLHHVPDTQQGMRECVKRLKPGAPFLLYLYYAFDNRPWWFRSIWSLSDLVRRLLSRLPFRVTSLLCEAIAALVYWPLARTAKLMERTGLPIAHFPLSLYRNRSFYIMRNDALDRFGTRLEKRFTRVQIREMMERAGLERITFSDYCFWAAVGYRALAPAG